MKLLVDIGNSRIKWAYLVNRELKDPQAHDYKEVDINELLENAWQDKNKPEHIFISNVAGKGIADKVSTVINNKWEISPVFAQTEQQCAGVTNAYRDITQFGIDRWLAVITSWDQYHTPACVVSCGTAVTIDGISKSGLHLGGLIVPGLYMMQNQLIKETNGINTDICSRFKLKFGRSTSECINNGAVRTIVSLIDDVAEEMSKEYGDTLSCIITGGYAEQINTLLSIKFDHKPHLVLNGLAILSEKGT